MAPAPPCATRVAPRLKATCPRTSQATPAIMIENAVNPMPLAPPSKLELAVLWTGLVAADTVSQLLFKAAALRLDEPSFALRWLAMVAQSPRVWAAVLCLLLTFALWMLVLRRAALSSAFPVTSLAIVCVVVASRVLFDEEIGPSQYAGIALIV